MDPSIYYANASGVLSAATVICQDVRNLVFHEFSTNNHSSLQLSCNGVMKIIDTSFDHTEIPPIMIEMNLEKCQGKPVEQFQAAWKHYETPVTDGGLANSSLIPMRESLHSIVEELLKRRQHQEASGKNLAKIDSIGRQLGLDGTQASTIERWAQEYDNLVNVLSSFKQKTVERGEWKDLLVRASLFLKSFLKGLDAKKFRSTP